MPTGWLYTRNPAISNIPIWIRSHSKSGPFVTHHFIELPSFFILGMGFSKFFADSGFSSVVSQILNVLIFLFNIFIGPGGRDRSSLIASYIVSFPELIGFYFHRYLIYYISDEKTLKWGCCLMNLDSIMKQRKIIIFL